MAKKVAKKCPRGPVIRIPYYDMSSNIICIPFKDHSKSQVYPKDMPFDGPEDTPYYATDEWIENCYEPPSSNPPPVPVPKTERDVFTPAQIIDESGPARNVHRVVENPFPNIPIGRKKHHQRPTKVPQIKTKNIESLVRSEDAERFINNSNSSIRSNSNNKNSVTNLVKGINQMPPMSQQQIEEIYLNRKDSTGKEAEPVFDGDAYKVINY